MPAAKKKIITTENLSTVREINDLLYQEKLTPGENITIKDDVISASITDVDLNTLLKADKANFNDVLKINKLATKEYFEFQGIKKYLLRSDITQVEIDNILPDALSSERCLFSFDCASSIYDNEYSSSLLVNHAALDSFETNTLCYSKEKWSTVNDSWSEEIAIYVTPELIEEAVAIVKQQGSEAAQVVKIIAGIQETDAGWYISNLLTDGTDFETLTKVTGDLFFDIFENTDVNLYTCYIGKSWNDQEINWTAAFVPNAIEYEKEITWDTPWPAITEADNGKVLTVSYKDAFDVWATENFTIKQGLLQVDINSICCIAEEYSDSNPYVILGYFDLPPAQPKAISLKYFRGIVTGSGPAGYMMYFFDANHYYVSIKEQTELAIAYFTTQLLESFHEHGLLQSVTEPGWYEISNEDHDYAVKVDAPIIAPTINSGKLVVADGVNNYLLSLICEPNTKAADSVVWKEPEAPKIVLDDFLSPTSENGITNRAITTALEVQNGLMSQRVSYIETYLDDEMKESSKANYGEADTMTVAEDPEPEPNTESESTQDSTILPEKPSDPGSYFLHLTINDDGNEQLAWITLQQLFNILQE